MCECASAFVPYQRRISVAGARTAPPKFQRKMEKKPTRLFNIAICLVVVLLSAAAVGVVVGVTLASRAADAINTTVVYNPPGAPPMPPMLPGMTSYEGSTMLAYFIGRHSRTPFAQPFCPAANQIDSLIPIPPVEPQPTYPYATCHEFYATESEQASLDANGEAADWCRGGSYFTFVGAGRNTQITNGGVQMWWRCDGPPCPGVLFIHGYPTSSWDTWSGVSKLLESTHRVCHVDHQGFGFSAKPRAPYYYSIYEHAAALNHFVTHVAMLTSFQIVTHDMGSSVGFAFLEKFVNVGTRLATPSFNVTHHTITNGNVWLPLSSLTFFQLALLDNTTGWAMEQGMTSNGYANAVGVYRPSLTGTSKADALGTTIAYQDGMRASNDVNQYLQQRACYENNWMAALNESSVPATLVWGRGGSGVHDGRERLRVERVALRATECARTLHQGSGWWALRVP